MPAMLASLGITVAKAVGAHLVHNSVPNRIESLVSGLGGRFFIGLGAGFYLQNAQFRHGANECFWAVKGVLTAALSSFF